MDSQTVNIFWTFSIFIILLFIIGFYCLLVTQNLVRALIAVEILMKAVTLFIIVSGNLSGRPAFAQALVVTLIVVETVAIAVAMGIVLSIYGNNRSLETDNLRNLKG